MEKSKLKLSKRIVNKVAKSTSSLKILLSWFIIQLLKLKIEWIIDNFFLNYVKNDIVSPLEPPKPKKIKKSLSAHNDKRIDYYYWLRDDERKNKEVIDYLKAENNYCLKWFESEGI